MHYRSILHYYTCMFSQDQFPLWNRYRCSHKICLQGNLAEESFSLERKESKWCLQEEQNSKYIIIFKPHHILFLSTKSKCHVTNVYIVEEYQKISHSLARKTKVSYYITFFQTLLKTFSCGLCYSESRINSKFVCKEIWQKNRFIFLCEMENKLLCLQ